MKYILIFIILVGCQAAPETTAVKESKESLEESKFQRRMRVGKVILYREPTEEDYQESALDRIREKRLRVKAIQEEREELRKQIEAADHQTWAQWIRN